MHVLQRPLAIMPQARSHIVHTQRTREHSGAPLRARPSSRHVPVLPHHSQRARHTSRRAAPGVLRGRVVEDLTAGEGRGRSEGGGVAVRCGGRREHGQHMRRQEGEEEGRERREVRRVGRNLLSGVSTQVLEERRGGGTYGLAGAGSYSDLVLASEPEDARILRDLAQELEPVKRRVRRRVGGGGRGARRRSRHHRREKSELCSDAPERT